MILMRLVWKWCWTFPTWKVILTHTWLRESSHVTRFCWYLWSNNIFIVYYLQSKICTPQLAQRAAELEMNNLQKELSEALNRQKLDPTFIIPLIFEGPRRDAVPRSLPSIYLFIFSKFLNTFDMRLYILAIDFSNPQEYIEKLTPIDPTGLIPMILDLENNFWYKTALSAYKYLQKSKVLIKLIKTRYELQK